MLGFLTFLHPWVLAGLAALPVLWLLLRVTPPAPRRIIFPPARFLAGLNKEDITPRKTPWWVLLLRIMIAALTIFALARPVLNPGTALPGKGALLLAFDNGWSSASNWDNQLAKARKLIDRAQQENRTVFVMTTAPEPGTDKVYISPPSTAPQARAIVEGLSPRPWEPDYRAAKTALENNPGGPTAAASYFFSSGLTGAHIKDFLTRLKDKGAAFALMPEDPTLPMLLRPAPQTGSTLSAIIDYPTALAKNTPVRVQALAKEGQILDSQTVAIENPKSPVTITFDLPPSLRQQVSQIRLAGRPGAGSVILRDDQSLRRTVGIVAPTGKEESAPFIEAGFYLTRALEPYTDTHSGTVTDLLALKPAALIMPDISGLPPADLNQLEEWVKQGGLLLRFAGPNMTRGENFLTPVPLRQGGRTLQGAMTWDSAQSLAPFPKHSPFYGLPLPQDDILVRQQILAEPVQGLEEMTWAALEDGTPLITAAPRERGLVVLVHTTATPQWSDMVLSGLFVQTLRRTIALAGQNAPSVQSDGTLQPLMVLDGRGAATAPPSFVTPLSGERFDKADVTSSHPPGIYGREGYRRAFNLGARTNKLATFEAPASFPVIKGAFQDREEKAFMPALLLSALLLYFLDWAVMIALQAGLFSRLSASSRTARAGPAAIFLVAFLATGLFCFAPPAFAQNNSEQNKIAYAGALHLAYFKSGNAQVDMTALKGLENLAFVLNQRTSVEPEGVVALNPATDELAFFPLIYWPLTAGQKALPTQALQNIQAYLDHGGTILIDTRGLPQKNESFAPPDPAPDGRLTQALSLQTLLKGLDIPPLKPMPEDHVLTRSFYLLDNLSGSGGDTGLVWVEENSASGRDGVSSVIIGQNNWAEAWAQAPLQTQRLFAPTSEEEMALRAGVNLVMYALTGNYKADQVHVPHILERLGP